MCTLTIIPARTGFRLVTSRDEQRSRPRAHPPQTRVLGGRAVLAPTDTLAGGTWVAVSDAGVALSLLNLNPVPAPVLPPTGSLRSRGAVIPLLIASPTASDAIDHLSRLDLRAFAPFRLVAADSSGVIDARWNRAGLHIARHALEPMCFVSSALGDHLVAPRLDLFDLFLRDMGPTPAMQDAYHKHHWPHRPEISVAMSRSDARTVSVTTVEVPGELTPAIMHYRDDLIALRCELPRIHTSSPSLPVAVAAPVSAAAAGVALGSSNPATAGGSAGVG